MALPEELEASFQQELQQYEQEQQMPYVTSIERMAKQEGIEEGIQQGMQQGMREGLLSGIELGLELKFGSEGLRLLPEISKIEDVDMLKAIKEGFKIVKTLAELRSLYQQNEPQLS
jgi:flagellar biosynthesis/type III secretory pathway protein FliH